MNDVVFINEIHYDNTGADTLEGIEIAGPAGTDLSCYELVLYNGSNSSSYSTTSLSGIIPDLECGFGTVWFPISGIQNGAPDGVALYDTCDMEVVQFLSYEGTITAVDLPAMGLTSSDIGVSESGSSAIEHSLQLQGTGSAYSDFTWAASDSATENLVNNAQSFCSNDAALTSIVSPVSGCGLGSTEDVTIEIVNNSASIAIDTIDVSYSLDGGTPVTVTLYDTIDPGDTLYYTFTTTVDLSTPSAYSIDAWVSLNGDGQVGNDSIIGYTLFNVSPASTPTLYNIDSELACGTTCGTTCTITDIWMNVGTDDIDWTVDANGTGSGGTGPAGDNTTGSGNYLYTEGSGCNGLEAILLSPCMDLSTMSNPYLKLAYHMYGLDMGNMYVEADTGDGNWMNLVTLSGQQQASNSDPWLYLDIDLSSLPAIASFRIRGVTGAQYTTDMAIDDIEFYNKPTDNVGAISVDAPNTGCGLDSAETVTITIVNNGLSTQDTIPVGYSINGDPAVLDTVFTTMNPGDTLSFSFSVPVDASAEGAYSIDAWTALGTDLVSTNDTAESDFYNGLEEVAVSVYSGDYGAEVSWEVTDINGMVLGMGGPYADMTTYLDTICVNTCVTYGFDMYDSFGDGWNNGTYTLSLVSSGAILSSGGMTTGFFASDPFQYCNLADAGVEDITEPVASCSLSDSEFVSINIVNYSATDTIDTIDIYYNLNGGTAVMETVVDTIYPGDTITYTFATAVDLSAIGSYSFNSWTDLNGDGDNSNDSLIGYLVNNVAPTATPNIYDIDSESACGTTCGAPCTLTDIWQNSSDDDIDWTVDAGGTGSPSTGPLADNTTGSGNYLYTEASTCYAQEAVLTSPCLDISTMSNPYFSFAYHMTGPTMGDLHVEVDSGDGNWSSIISLSGAQQATQADPWIIADINLAGYPSIIQLRFRGITGTNYYSDMAIDDIQLYSKSADNVGTIAIESPNSGCGLDSAEDVTITIINPGLSVQDTIPVGYSINGGTPVFDTVFSTMNPGDTISFTFSVQADLSSPGSYTIDAWTALGTDIQNLNDSVNGVIVDHLTPFTGLPAVYDIDAEAACGTTCGSVCVLSATEWTNATDDNIDWAVDAGGTGSTNTGPLADNTTGSGNYLYTEASGCYAQEAILISSCMDLSVLSGPMLGFAYHMHGGSMGDLYVEVNDGSGWNNVFTASGQQQTVQTDPWLNANIDLGAYSGSVVRIRFRGITGANFYSDMAIDDIQLFNKPPNDIALISIDSPVTGCGLTATETITVTISNAGSTVMDTIPVSYSLDGGAVVTDTIIATLNPGDSLTYSFTTTADLSTPGVYTIDAWTAALSDTINTNDSILANSINNFLAAPSPPFMYDIDSETACVTTCGSPCTLTGGWANSTDDDMDWTVDAAGTPSTATGPAVDNTTGSATGNYLYTESSGCNGLEAILMSPCIDLGAYTNPFLSFAYHMYGADMGDLYVEIDTGTGVWNTIFTASGQQQTAQPDPWILGEINLSTYSGTILLRFRGITGAGFNSDMALDDINIINKEENDISLASIITPNTGCDLSAAEPITIELINNGYGTQDTIIVSYSIDGGAIVSDTIYTNLLGGDTLIYPFTTPADLSAGGAYSIDVWAWVMGDSNSSNDSAEVDVYNGLEQVSVALFSGDFAGEVSWDITDAINGAVLGEGSGYTTNSTIYYDTLCVNKCESFSFNMYDSYGDGWNLATYTVTLVSSGDTIAEGGITTGFFGSDNFQFCDQADAGVNSLAAPMYNCNLSDSEMVAVYIINYSVGDTIDTISVSYNVNGGSPVMETIITTIAPGDSLLHVFSSTVDMSTPGMYSITSWTNLNGDINAANDTLSGVSIYNGLEQVSVALFSGDFAGEVSWDITDAINGDVLGEGSGYTTNSTIYYDTLCINKCESFNFNMYDSFGDGWNLATYTVTLVTSGDTIAEGGITSGFFGSDIFQYCDQADAGVIALAAPMNNCSLSDSEMVAVYIINYSAGDTIDTVTVSYSVNGGTPIMETVITTIAPGDTLLHVFSSTVDMSSPGVFSITSWTNLNGDVNAANDTLSGVSVYNVLPAPYIETFDGLAIGASGSMTNGWTATPDIDYHWLANSGQTSSINTGPTGDHTTGSGNYMYTEASTPAVAGDMADLISWCIDLSPLTSPQLGFWYHKYGVDMETMYITVVSSMGIPTIVDSIVGQTQFTNADTWLFRQVDLNAFTGQTIFVAFTGVRGISFDGDMAIDDVMLGDAPSVDLGPDAGFCDSITLDAGAGYASYAWSTGDSTQTITMGTSDTIMVTVTNNMGFQGMDTIVVTVDSNAAPNIVISGNTTICSGDTANLTASGADTYSWSTGDSTATIVVVPAADTMYTVQGTNSCGTSTDTVSVTVLAAPVASATSTTICFAGDTTMLMASGGTDYAWSTGDSTDYIIVAPTSDTSYTVVVSNQCGSDTAIASVTITGLPVASISGNADVCEGDTANLVAMGGDNYSWSTGDSTDSITVTPMVTTTYDVSVSNACGTDSASATVSVHALPSVDLGTDTTICDTATMTLDAGAGYASYAWSDGSMLQTLAVSDSGVYWVEVTDTNGCSGSDTVAVSETPCSGVGLGSSDAIGIELYPNPSNGIVTVQIAGTKGSAVLITVRDMIGQEVYQERIDNLPGTFNKQLDLSKSPMGVYFFTVEMNDKSVTHKLVIE